MKVKGKVFALGDEKVIKMIDKNGHPREMHRHEFSMVVDGVQFAKVISFEEDFKTPKVGAEIEVDVRSGQELQSTCWEFTA